MCETSFLLYRGLFAFAAALVATVALGFAACYEDGIAAVAHPQWGLILCHHEAEHHLQAQIIPVASRAEELYNVNRKEK